ncbi:MAG: peptidase domain-containing ABC transporter [Rhodospirillaceae bacterium]|nr:peptidase domain-containing ABC transporter [Rhodospirillaceae bacterium]
MTARIARLGLFGAQTPLIRQGTVAECGLACLAMIAGHYGYRADLNGLRLRHQPSLRGMNLRQVLNLAARLNLSGRAVRLEPEQLGQLRLPAILHWGLDHFVVLDAIKGRKFRLLDPAQGNRLVGPEEMSKQFTGVAVELQPNGDFRPADIRRRLNLTSLWSRITGLKRNLAQVLTLSVLLQAAAMTAPLQLQLTIDQALVKSDRDLLLVILIGFAGLGGIVAVTSFLRRIVVLQLGQALAFGMVSNVFNHLIRLPIAWFENRHVGDVVSRFESTTTIKDFIAGNLIGVILDGIMAVITLAILFVYSPMLAGLVAAGLAITLSISFSCIPLFQHLTEERLAAAAKEDSVFLETLRAAPTIKLFGREAERFALWQNSYVGIMNTRRRYEMTDASIDLLLALLVTLIGGGIAYLAANMVMDQRLTIGMMMSFGAYQAYFSGAVTTLVQTVTDYNMLDVHMDRLADIVLEKSSTGQAERGAELQLVGHIELKNVSFRYHPDEPAVLENVSLVIAAGETVAITGASGGGKTTLMKLMAGVLRPTSGELLIDDLPMQSIGEASLRRQVAVIQQDDQLLSGSIADNISFFDTESDLARVETAARLAAIHDDIVTMPMGYASLVGDMGSSLSGGQKQRIMIARALYHQPRILFMDEGTAHLDLDIERTINNNLRGLDITRIIIAHRPDTVRIADRVLLVENKNVQWQAPRTRRKAISKES